MTRDELDTLWQKALIASVCDNELYTRYHFAALVQKAEREACAKVAAEPQGWAMPSFNHAPSDRTIGRIEGEKAMSYRIAAAIRARGEV